MPTNPNVYREIIGFFTPAQNGEHIFKIDAKYATSILWFGESEAEANRIAHIEQNRDSATATGHRDWDGRQESSSAPRNLVAGQRYFIRAVANSAEVYGLSRNIAIGWSNLMGTVYCQYRPPNGHTACTMSTPSPTRASLYLPLRQSVSYSQACDHLRDFADDYCGRGSFTIQSRRCCRRSCAAHEGV